MRKMNRKARRAFLTHAVLLITRGTDTDVRFSHAGPTVVNQSPTTWLAGPCALVWASNHQDPATTLLLPCRAHPLGAPPHFASSPALALGKPVRSRPGTIARLAISCLTAPSAPDPPTKLLNRLEDSRQVAPRVSLAAYRPDNLAQHRHCGPSTSSLLGYRTLHTAKSIGIKASLSPSLASHPLSDRHTYIPSVDSG